MEGEWIDLREGLSTAREKKSIFTSFPYCVDNGWVLSCKAGGAHVNALIWITGGLPIRVNEFVFWRQKLFLVQVDFVLLK